MFVRFRNGPSFCYIVLEKDRERNEEVFTLYGVQTQEGQTGKGHAIYMVQEVLAFAESMGIPVRLFVEKYYHKTLNNNQLIRWYSKNGFKVDNLLHDNIWMRYDPVRS